MRISDWSSDVCSSDLGAAAALRLAYREHGEGLFDHLTGAFALAILDSANRRALLAVDRMGVHGLYYAQPPGAGLVFGTTADMVRASTEERRGGEEWGSTCRSPWVAAH